ncbi:MAG: hypothetical protein MRY32_05470 [Rickettsiales bacterium]|nr:hypothetical protein [Rickettsiales bacterium]
MRKFEYQKKRLTIEAIIVGVLVVAILIGVFVVSDLHQSRKDDLRAARRQTQQLENKATEYEEQINVAGVSTQIYDELSFRKASMNFMVDRNILREKLAALKERFRMNHLSVEASPESNYQNKELDALGVTAKQSLIELNFGAMSDVHVFSFVRALSYEMPGLVRPVLFEMRRDQPLNNQNLRLIKAGQSPQMVSGEFQFMWYGFSPDEKETNAP